MKVDTFGMVNLIAGRRIVPELIQDDFTPERVAEETVGLLTDPARAAEMRRALAEVRGALGRARRQQARRRSRARRSPWPTPRRSPPVFSYSSFPIPHSAMRRLPFFLVSALLLAFAAHVDAIVYVAADFQTLVSEAHTIVLGRIASLEPEWTEGRRGIETLLSIDVERTLKGSAGERSSCAFPADRWGRT